MRKHIREYMQKPDLHAPCTAKCWDDGHYFKGNAGSADFSDGRQLCIVAEKEGRSSAKETGGELTFMEVFYIGGSPCSGKSSIAELIVAKHNFTYYKLDDFIFSYMEQAADSGAPISAAQMSMDFEQMWMRDPEIQAEEEFAVYAEIFPYALKDIAALNSERPIVAEGAGFYPELMKKQGVPANRYICIVPTERFQRENYAKREWIGEFLKGCSDPSAAFDNWMRRDTLFAAEVLNQAKMFGYASISVDGKSTIAENYEVVVNAFELA